MIDLASETLLTLNQTAKRLPCGRQGRPMHMSAVLRWIISGLPGPNGRRVRLEALRVGGRWVSSEEALQRFAQRLTPRLEDDTTLSPRTASQRERASARAAEKLANEGI